MSKKGNLRRRNLGIWGGGLGIGILLVSMFSPWDLTTPNAIEQLQAPEAFTL